MAWSDRARGCIERLRGRVEGIPESALGGLQEEPISRL